MNDQEESDGRSQGSGGGQRGDPVWLGITTVTTDLAESYRVGLSAIWLTPADHLRGANRLRTRGYRRL